MKVTNKKIFYSFFVLFFLFYFVLVRETSITLDLFFVFSDELVVELKN